MKNKVYILILNWNNWMDTLECLDSGFQSSYPNFQVLVIDNASSDDSEERILRWAEDRSIPFVRYDRQEAEEGGILARERALTPGALVFIQAGENLGYAGGNNVGIRYSLKHDDCAYLWILNNDTVVEKDALSEMVNLAEAEDKIGMVGSKLLYYDRPDMLQAAGGCRVVPWMGNASIIAGNQRDDGRWDNSFEPDYLSGASLLVKREVFDRIGLMEEKYFLYWEDAEWGVRARRQGYRIFYCPTSRVRHKEGSTVGYMSFQADYYWVRNGLYFTQKYYPWFLPFVFIAYLAKYTLVRIFKKQPLNFRAYIRGVGDFLKGRTGRIPESR